MLQLDNLYMHWAKRGNGISVALFEELKDRFGSKNLTFL